MAGEFGKKSNPNRVNVPGAGQFGKKRKVPSVVVPKTEVSEEIETEELDATSEEGTSIENALNGEEKEI